MIYVEKVYFNWVVFGFVSYSQLCNLQLFVYLSRAIHVFKKRQWILCLPSPFSFSWFLNPVSSYRSTFSCIIIQVQIGKKKNFKILPRHFTGGPMYQRLNSSLYSLNVVATWNGLICHELWTREFRKSCMYPSSKKCPLPCSDFWFVPVNCFEMTIWCLPQKKKKRHYSLLKKTLKRCLNISLGYSYIYICIYKGFFKKKFMVIKDIFK